MGLNPPPLNPTYSTGLSKILPVWKQYMSSHYFLNKEKGDQVNDLGMPFTMFLWSPLQASIHIQSEHEEWTKFFFNQVGSLHQFVKRRTISESGLNLVENEKVHYNDFTSIDNSKDFPWNRIVLCCQDSGNSYHQINPGTSGENPKSDEFEQLCTMFNPQAPFYSFHYC